MILSGETLLITLIMGILVNNGHHTRYSLYSLDDAFIVRNINIFLVFFNINKYACYTWPMNYYNDLIFYYLCFHCNVEPLIDGLFLDREKKRHENTTYLVT